MNTQDYKTKSIIEYRHIPSNPKYWAIGLDIGYSSVKGMSPNKYFCFPAYARKVPADRLTLKAPQSTDIRYREKSNDEIWTVGALAYDEVNSSEVMDSEAELFGRRRYFSPMFLVIARVGIALGMMNDPYGKRENRRVKIQMGLPPKYMNDEDDLRESLVGHHEFEIKLGNQPWQSFDFTIEPEDIPKVMAQPLGALMSASIGKDGMQLPVARQYFSKNVIVFDPGFGTTDDYTITHGVVTGYETFPELGMREVFARTCHDIKKQYRVEIQIPELQNKLVDGTIKSMDRRLMKSTKHSFADILEKNSKEVCHETIEKLKTVHNYFIDTDYIIAAGGTYDAWASEFNQTFKDMEGLSIVPGNINDPSLSNVFDNVRGYYYYLNHSLR